MITPQLLELAANRADDDLLDVIVELPAPQREPSSRPSNAPREAYVQRLTRTFDAISHPLRSAIEELGGRILGEAPIIHSLKVRIPAGQLERLDQQANVERIDLPPRPLLKERVSR